MPNKYCENKEDKEDYEDYEDSKCHKAMKIVCDVVLFIPRVIIGLVQFSNGIFGGKC
jgi:hypothetical protein